MDGALSQINKAINDGSKSMETRAKTLERNITRTEKLLSDSSRNIGTAREGSSAKRVEAVARQARSMGGRGNAAATQLTEMATTGKGNVQAMRVFGAAAEEIIRLRWPEW